LISIIKEIANTLSPKRLGLTHSSFTLKVFFDKTTGRLPLTTDAVKASSPNIPEQLLKNISLEIFNRLRKRNFLKNSGKDASAKDVIVKNDSNPANNIADNVEASFSPVPTIALPDRPGVRQVMKQMWNQTQDSIDKKDPRGFSLTVYIDKDGSLRSFVVKKGDPPFITKDGLIIFKEDCGGTFVDEATDTPLGSIHTHPVRTPPSFKDHEMARDSSSICGVEHFMINEDFVIKYDATSDSDPIDREKFLGN
jgi:hypothetical protein